MKLTKVSACPVCHDSRVNALSFLKQRIDPSRLSPLSYASRKMPEFMRHELVKCRACDLIYATSNYPESFLVELYTNAEFDSSIEAADAANSYIIEIKDLLSKCTGSERVLEIGCGTGVFLEYFKNKTGCLKIEGIEPSSAAINAAPLNRKSWITCGNFLVSNFDAESYDFIFCFMTLEHIMNPAKLVADISKLLSPNGNAVFVVHNHNSLINKILGAKSPIIDIEHIQIFSEKSLKFLINNANLKVMQMRPFINSYSIYYWVKLMPIPLIVKRPLLRILKNGFLGSLKVKIPTGNLICIAKKDF